MQRIFLVWFSLCCILFAARAEHEGVNLNPSDANIFGHVVDKKQESISLISIFSWRERQSERLPMLPDITH